MRDKFSIGSHLILYKYFTEEILSSEIFLYITVKKLDEHHSKVHTRYQKGLGRNLPPQKYFPNFFNKITYSVKNEFINE